MRDALWHKAAIMNLTKEQFGELEHASDILWDVIGFRRTGKSVKRILKDYVETVTDDAWEKANTLYGKKAQKNNPLARSGINEFISDVGKETAINFIEAMFREALNQELITIEIEGEKEDVPLFKEKSVEIGDNWDPEVDGISAHFRNYKKLEVTVHINFTRPK